MTPIRTFLLTWLAITLLGSPTLAQSDIAARTAVSFIGGAASTRSTTGLVLGGSRLFDLNERVAVEAQGTYFDRGAGVDAISVSGAVLVNLRSARQRIVPYGAIGAGLYRASFDLANPALLGPVGGQFGPGAVVRPAPGSGVGPGPGAGFGTGTGTCPATVDGHWGVGQMPRFYARRLGPMRVPLGGAWESRSFTDPAVTLGGGVRFNVNEHLLVRPDIRALVVFANGATHTLGGSACSSGIGSEPGHRSQEKWSCVHVFGRPLLLPPWW